MTKETGDERKITINESRFADLRVRLDGASLNNIGWSLFPLWRSLVCEESEGLIAALVTTPCSPIKPMVGIGFADGFYRGQNWLASEAIGRNKDLAGSGEDGLKPETANIARRWARARLLQPTSAITELGEIKEKGEVNIGFWNITVVGHMIGVAAFIQQYGERNVWQRLTNASPTFGPIERSTELAHLLRDRVVRQCGDWHVMGLVFNTVLGGLNSRVRPKQ